MKDREILSRLRSDEGWYGTLLALKWDLNKGPLGRPKVPNEIKALKRDLKLFFLLTDICRLRLNKIRSNSFVADQLRKKFPDDYPPTRKTKTEKVVRPSLSKEIGAALKLLQNHTRLDELFGIYEAAYRRAALKKKPAK
jgi:hypothetical protein